MCNIVNINGKNFLNDYINFGSEYCRSDRARRNSPTLKCLVHIWQNSNDLLDFWDNMVSAHEHWLKHSPFAEEHKHPLITRGYTDRAFRLRISGVKLKRYENDNKSVRNLVQTRELNKIAAITVT